VAKAKQDVADMADKTHTILIAGGSGLVGHAAIKFAIAAGHFVIALVRSSGSLSVEGLASEETLKIIEVDFDALDHYQPEISALAPNALICALGTTIRKAGSKDGFARVDRDYVAAFAALGRTAGASHFGLVSAVGADARSSNFYLAPKAKRKRPFAPAAICASTTRVRVFFWVSGLKLVPVSASASLQRRWLRHY
jgi:NAD(P)-dependent dehydrogenase (short-subunit alcohol dehydrogenase family)